MDVTRLSNPDEPRTPERTGTVIVVGAGAIGVSTAFHLATHGVDVTLLDKGHAAGETTGKAAGLVYSQFHEPADVRAMQYSLSFFEELDRTDSSFTFHKTGYVRIGTEAERAVFEREVAMQRDCGVDVRLVDRDEIAKIEPILNLDGITIGTYCADDGFVDPHTFTTALLAEAQAAGVDYRPNTSVTDIDVRDGTVRDVTTSTGMLTAESVVISAGPWSKRVCSLVDVELPAKPYRTQALVTDVVDFEVIPVYDAHDQVYFRSESEGILGGDGTEEVEADPENYDESGDFDFLSTVGNTLEKRLPVSSIGVVNSWAGLSTATPDGFPLVGCPPTSPGGSDTISGLYVGTGLQGHGIMRSPAVGRQLANMIVYDDPTAVYPEYDAGRFTADPGDFSIEEMMKVNGTHGEQTDG